MDFFIKPISDIFIRYLFGLEENKDLLLSFINSVMIDSEFPELIEVEIKNPFNLKNIVFDKESILDVKATDNYGRQYDIEVQTFGDSHFKIRSLYYWAKLYVSQLSEGNIYRKLKPTICINILDFTPLQGIQRPHTCFMLHEIKEQEYILTDHLMIHFLELPKFNNYKSHSKIDHWLTYLKMEGKGGRNYENSHTGRQGYRKSTLSVYSIYPG